MTLPTKGIHIALNPISLNLNSCVFSLSCFLHPLCNFSYFLLIFLSSPYLLIPPLDGIFVIVSSRSSHNLLWLVRSSLFDRQKCNFVLLCVTINNYGFIILEFFKFSLLLLVICNLLNQL